MRSYSVAQSTLMSASRSGADETKNALWDVIGSQLTLVDYGGSRPVVGEKWEIERVLGRGGFGLVCAARDLSLPRRVAIKLLPQGPEMLSLIREARSLALLEHPAIVTIFEIDQGMAHCGEQSIPCGWIAMQLVDGDTLDGWVKKTRPRAPAIVALIVAVGRALAHAHAKGILHRDLKPTNVMIDARGRPFVIDFGLAIASAMPPTESFVDPRRGPGDALGERVTTAGAWRGTPGYMAPEAVGGQPSPASDQYSLAVLAWEALAGDHPWRATHEPSKRAGAGRAEPWRWQRIKPVLLRGMASRPSDRFETVDAFCGALEATTTRRWWGRFAAMGIATAAVAGALAAGTHGAGWWSSPKPSSTVNPSTSGATTSSAVEVGPCDGLDSWAGHWNLMGKVVWTEYSNQLEQFRPLGMSVEILPKCDVQVRMNKFQPAGPQGPDEILAATTQTTPIQVDGSRLLVYDISFPGDRRTYGARENLEFALTLDRSDDGRPMLRGAFAKVQTESGLVLRTGWVLGRRDRSATLPEVEAHDFPCQARCRVHCAGVEAINACIERRCAPYNERFADPCGPPSSDFIAPLRTRAERRELRAGRPFGAVATGDPGDCETNATRVLGSWALWRVTEDGPELSRVEVAADGCRLQAMIRGAEPGPISMTGEITEMGIWYLARAPHEPVEMSTLVFAGAGPAFGVDTAEPSHLLRAFRP